MKADLKERFKKVYKPLDNNLKDQLYIFGICLGISLFFWVLIKLSKDYSTTIKYPVKYSGFSSDYYLSEGPKPFLFFEINSNGSDLISNKYFKRQRTVDIDLNNYPMLNRGEEYLVKVPTNTLIKNLALETAFYNKLNRVTPDTLYFRFEDVTTKKVPIIGDVNIELEQQHLFYDSIKITPDSIELKGTVSDLSMINYLKTEFLEESDVDESFEENLELIYPDNLHSIERLIEEVLINISVEEYTEDNKEVKVQVYNVPDNFEMKIFPEKVRINYLVSLKDFSEIDENSFLVDVQFNETTNQSRRQLNVNIGKIPEHIKILSIEPSSVEFILIQKND